MFSDASYVGQASTFPGSYGLIWLYWVEENSCDMYEDKYTSDWVGRENVWTGSNTHCDHFYFGIACHFILPSLAFVFVPVFCLYLLNVVLQILLCRLVSCSTSESLMSPVKQAPRKSPSDTEGLVNHVPARLHQVNFSTLQCTDLPGCGRGGSMLWSGWRWGGRGELAGCVVPCTQAAGRKRDLLCMGLDVKL